MCFSTVQTTVAPTGCLLTKDKHQRYNECRKGVQFATKAECHLVTSIDDMTPTEVASLWYSKSELFAQDLPKSPSECYSEKEKERHMDTVLDAQDLLDEMGTADAASQARILAAIASKSSQKSRQRSSVKAAAITA